MSISKFEQYKLRKSKPGDASNSYVHRTRLLIALKFILSETVKNTIDGVTLGSVQTVKDEIQDTVTDVHIDEMVECFDKAWRQFYLEHKKQPLAAAE